MFGMKNGLLFFLLVFWSGFLSAQKTVRIQEDSSQVFSYFSWPTDSLAQESVKREVISGYHAKGFVSAWLQPLGNEQDTIFYTLKKGEKYFWKKLEGPKEVYLASSIKEVNGVFTEKKWKDFVNKNLSYYENTGYPFAQLYLDSLTIVEDSVSAVLRVQKNQFIIMDSIELKGKVKTSVKVIESYLNFEKGKPYSESYISKLGKNLNAIPFLTVIRSPEVYFYEGKARIVLYLEEKKNNRFDGVLGLNPNETNGRVEIVGEVNIALRNSFKKGELIRLNWEKIKENSQQFNLEFHYPFLLGSRIGLKTDVNYFRQDTSFANLQFTPGFSYFIDNNQEFSVLFDVIRSNSLLTSDNVSQVPLINSVSSNYIGFRYKGNTLDYALNPRKGVALWLSLNSGQKTVDKSGASQSQDFEAISEKSTQFKIEAKWDAYFPVFKKATVLVSLKTGNLIGDNIFRNELYQIGGLSTIRGFNQQSIFASNYYIANTEFRYLFDRNSAVFAFFDAGFYENNTLDNYDNGLPMGAGVGVNFQTNSGIFTLTYGLGKEGANPVLVRNGKVHFGFISLF